MDKEIKIVPADESSYIGTSGYQYMLDESAHIGERYPLFPPLSEEGQKEAVQLIENFKETLKKSAEDVITGLYCDVLSYIESDSWSNFRNQIMEGFQNYDNRKIQSKYEFAKIRAQLFKEFKADIIPELNQDILNENDILKKQIEHLRSIMNNKY